MLIALIILSCLAIMSDAFVTRYKILHGSHESNKTRKFLIDKLGLNAGTFGVGMIMSIAFSFVCWISVMSPSTVVSCLMVIFLFSFVSYSQWIRK